MDARSFGGRDALRVVPLPENLQVAFSALATMVLVVLTATFWLAPDSGEGQVIPGHLCDGALKGNRHGSSLTKSTDPAGGSVTAPRLIAAGTTVSVTITWDRSEWSSLSHISDCVFGKWQADGRIRRHAAHQRRHGHFQLRDPE